VCMCVLFFFPTRFVLYSFRKNVIVGAREHLFWK
jgi:hypothetical protein